MRLIVVINVFNEALNIEKAIESVHEVADEIRLYDGAYECYPHEVPYSTDGTLEIARKFPKVKIFETKKAYKDQLEKRSRMFEDSKEGDYFFILDGDEYIANPEVIRDYMNADVVYGWTLSNLYEKPYTTVRMIKYQKGIHMAGRHHWIYDGRNRFICSHQRYSERFTSQIAPIRAFNFRDRATRLEMKDDKRQFIHNRNLHEMTYNIETDVYHEDCKMNEVEFRASNPREITQIIREWKVKPKYTMSLMFSRTWAVDKYIECLRQLEIPENTEMIVVIDSNMHMIRRRLTDFLERDTRFTGVKMFVTGRPSTDEFGNVNQRRKRILSNWHLILTEARGDILLGSEDDSLPEPKAYTKLIAEFNRLGADFIQGNIIGRWNANINPAWKVIEQNGQPKAVYTLKEKFEGIEPIEACGWYCFVSKVDLFRKYAMELDTLLPNGPDLRQGYILHKNGYRLYHHWGVKVEHFTEDKSLRVGKDATEQRGWIKSKSGDWVIKKYPDSKLPFESRFNDDIERFINLNL